jgi:hypothetical protein
MSSNKTDNLNMHKWVGTDNVQHLEFVENFDIIDKELGQQGYKKVKSGKDANKIFTNEKWYRSADNTLFREFILSGGTSPSYTTLTMKEYAADGTTVIVTKTWTLAYDTDGDLSSVTPN